MNFVTGFYSNRVKGGVGWYEMVMHNVDGKKSTLHLFVQISFLLV